MNSRFPAATIPPQERASTRDDLLTAASDLMCERDTLLVPIIDIAAKAGVNSALVKYYFGNKSGLMRALLQRDLSEAVTQLEALVEMDMRPTAKMRYHLSGLIKMYFKYPYLQRLLTVTMRDETEEVRSTMIKSYIEPIHLAYKRMISDGVADGEFQFVDHKFFYFIVIGACDQIFSSRDVLQYMHGVDKIDENIRRSYTEQMIAVILKGLTARA